MQRNGLLGCVQQGGQCRGRNAGHPAPALLRTRGAIPHGGTPTLSYKESVEAQRNG